jgi:hypothetical protein
MGRDLMGVSHQVRILQIEQLTYSALVLPKASRTAADSSPPNFEIALGWLYCSHDPLILLRSGTLS